MILRTISFRFGAVPGVRRGYGAWLLGAWLCLLATVASGDPRPDGGVADARTDNDASTSDAGAPVRETGSWIEQRSRALREEVAQLRSRTDRIRKLTLDDPRAAGQNGLFEVDLSDPAAVGRRIDELKAGIQRAGQMLRESNERMQLIVPAVQRRQRELERQRRRRPARRAALDKELRLVRLRLDLIRGEHAQLAAQADLDRARVTYLDGSQPARRTAAEHRRIELGTRVAAEHREARLARAEAEAQQRSAEEARQNALVQQRKARSELARELAAERARLEGIRGEQARLEHDLAEELEAKIKLQLDGGLFRERIRARMLELEKDWPASATRFNRVYDDVVDRLVQLRPQAISDLWAKVRGSVAVPRAGELPRRLTRLASGEPELAALQHLATKLDDAAAKLAARRDQLVDSRLRVLRRQVTWLNQRRIRLLGRVSADKRRDLSGFSRATAAQIGREVTQLVFDAVYWSVQRRGQLHQIGQLVIDIFAVTAVTGRALLVLLWLLLLRMVARRWDGWFRAIGPTIARAVDLGRLGPFTAKLIDLVRHAGPALLGLTTVIVLYRVVQSATPLVELQVVYLILFWWLVYRVLMRMVESFAEYIGADDPTPLVEAPDLADPHADPQAMLSAALIDRPTGELRAVTATPNIGPSPATLTIRSFRTVTRYLLVVVLILELAELAVGRGSIYMLTTRFFWWAAFPFAVYILLLWRPHIVRAYQRMRRTKPHQRLDHLVDQAETRFYGIFVVAAALAFVLADRATKLGRRYLRSQEGAQRVSAFLFRRRVKRRAEQEGRIVTERQQLPAEILEQFPEEAIDRAQGALRPVFMDDLKRYFSTWQEERADGSVALVGPAGIGKSTALRMLGHELGVPIVCGSIDGKLIRSLRVVSWLGDLLRYDPKPSSVKELVAAIRADERPVIAIDACHNLFLRRVGGFEGWETFVRIVNETCDTAFWVMAFNEPAWAYLFNAGGRVQYFRRIVPVAPWTERRIRRLLLHRMAQTGYGVSFSDLVLTQMPDVDLSVQTGRTSAGYFRMLWDYTNGNPLLAGHFWLDSLVPDTTTRSVRVRLFSEPEGALLDALPANTAFVLTAVIEHENITAAEAATATRLSFDFCKFALTRGIEGGYLERLPNGRVRISARWQQTMMRYLRRRHLLHDWN